jgi:hypothetical protein
MIYDIINLYRIGKTLRLKPSEISNILTDKKRQFRSNLMVSFFIVSVLVFIIVLISIMSSIIGNTAVNTTPDNTYTTGTFYSTVKLKDFKKKR